MIITALATTSYGQTVAAKLKATDLERFLKTIFHALYTKQ